MTTIRSIQLLSPGKSGGHLVIPVTGMLDEDIRVPDRMEIRMLLSEEDNNFVAPSFLCLRMQRLVYIAEEMEEESQRLAFIREAGGFIPDSSRLVHDRGYDASTLHGAVARDVDAALAWWVVQRVDVVPARSVVEHGHVADFVGEEGGFGDVLGVEEGLHILAGVGG